MTEARPAAPVPAPPRWGRLLVGCAVGGGLLVLAGFAAFAFGLYWLLGPGRQAPTAAVVGEQSAGVIHVGDLAADPGARALLGDFMARAQAAPGGSPLPQWMRNLQAAQARQGISQWLPREATFSFEPREDEALGMSAAVNLRGMVQPIRLAMSQALAREKGSTVSKHGRHELIGLAKSGTAVCFMDGTIVLAPDVERLAAAIDRLEPAVEQGAPAEAPERALAGAWDVRGWLDGPLAERMLAGLLAGRGEGLATALELADGPALPPGLRSLRFGLDVRTSSDAEAALDLRFASEADASAAEQPLTAALQGRLAQEPGLTAAVTPRLDGARLRLDVALQDLDEMIARRMAERPRHPGE